MKKLLCISLLFISIQVYSQICTATNSKGCGKPGDITFILVKNEKGDTLGIYSGFSCGTSSKNLTINSGKPMVLRAGERLQVWMKGRDTLNLFTQAAAWIDANRNDSFEASECVGTPTVGPFKTLRQAQYTSGYLFMPCFNSLGKSILRFRGVASNQKISSGNGCGSLNISGNILDIEVDLKSAVIPKPNFRTSEDTLYQKRQIEFISDNQLPQYHQQWTFPFGTSYISNVGATAIAKINGTGSYDVKLVVSLCGVSDSVDLQVTLKTPSKAPVANFTVDHFIHEINTDLQIRDASSNGAYSFSWEFIAPDNKKITSAAQNPIFKPDVLGYWKVCITASNGVGASTKLCRDSVFRCYPKSKYLLDQNSNYTYSDSGYVYDHGYDTANYSPGSYIYDIKLGPFCRAVKQIMTFHQLKLDSGAQLTIYDGNSKPQGLIINASNQAQWRGKSIVANQGYFEIEFQHIGNKTDSGFIIGWTTVLDTIKKLNSWWTTTCNPAYNGAQINFFGHTNSAVPQMNWEWIVDGNPYMGFNQDFSYTFTTDGSYEVCVVASACFGEDTFCKYIDIVTPTDPVDLDIFAGNRNPAKGETVQLKALSCAANSFEWSISPPTFLYAIGSQNSKEPVVKFNVDTCYTITVKAWNSVGGQLNTQQVLEKKFYICLRSYSTPKAKTTDKNFAIERIKINRSGHSDSWEYKNAKTDGSYTLTSGLDTAILHCLGYKLEVERNGFGDSAVFKAFLDFNRNGKFTNFGELILHSTTSTDSTFEINFSVPSYMSSSIMEGLSRLRVGCAEPNVLFTPDSIGGKGAFADFVVDLQRDKNAPVLSLKNKDTAIVETTSTVSGCFNLIAGYDYTAQDAEEGDLTSNVVVTSNINCKVPGVYYYTLKICDCSGNCSELKKYVHAVNDLTPPVLSLKGIPDLKDTTIVCSPYTIPAATAIDAKEGDISNKVILQGSVNTSVPGKYNLRYTVSDKSNNADTLYLQVLVMDTLRPHLHFLGKNLVNHMLVEVPLGGTFTDSVRASDSCMGGPKIVAVPGFNGPVNTAIRGTYPYNYYATDSAGNLAWENGYEVRYLVEDRVPPVISLNTKDTICHEINTAYNPINATATDNYFQTKDISITRSGSVNAFVSGLYVEMWVATDGAGNKDTAYRYIIVGHCSTGIGGMKLEYAIRVWPNPADKKLYVRSSNNMPLEMQLINPQGQRIPLPVHWEKDFYTMDVSDIPGGFYILKVCNASGCVERQIVIVR